MEIILPDEIYKVITKFTKAGYRVYLVGGAVRDILMKKPHKDWDLTTDATPEQILELFPDGFYENTFGTVGINTPHGVLEITTMRKEGEYKDSRRPSEVTWTNEINEDLSRRDFTINAIAIELDSSHPIPLVIDPFSGREDLDKKLIRAVGDPACLAGRIPGPWAGRPGLAVGSSDRWWRRVADARAMGPLCQRSRRV